MSEITSTIKAALQSEDPIQREQVRAWIRDAQDVGTLACLYALTDEAWDRIDPRLEMEETCQLISRYLLQCIRDDPQGTDAMPRYEAAGVLESWIDHVSTREGTQDVIHQVVAAVTQLFIAGNYEIRDAIETGFLEHVLEQKKFRPFFSNWANDERLSDAWKRALAWGEAHPDYMKEIREELRALQRRKN